MMKKMVALIGAALMTVSAAAFVACESDRGGDNPIWTSAVTAEAPATGALTALEGYSSSGSSGNGWYRFSRYNAEAGTTEYAIYNIVSDQMFTSETSFSMQSGLYVTMVTTTPEDPAAEPVTTYTFYDMNGEVVKANSDELNISYGGATFRDGRYFAKLPDGSYEVMNTSLGKNYMGGDNVYAVGAYYLELTADSTSGLLIDVYDMSRAYVRTVDVSRDMGLPIMDDLNLSVWDVGGKLFIQAQAQVPYDTDHDLAYGDMAIRLYTMEFDPSSEKVKEVKNFNFMVMDEVGLAPGANAVILEGIEIVDKKPASEGIQMFGQDGKRYTDVQELLLNANDIRYSGNYVVLSSDREMQIYDSGELAYSYDKTIYGAMQFCDGFLYANGAVYTLTGQRMFEVEQSTYSHVADGLIWFYGMGKMCGYDLNSGEVAQEQTISYSSGNYYLSANADGTTYSLYMYGSGTALRTDLTSSTFSVSSYTDDYTEAKYDLISVGTSYYRVKTDEHVW